MTDDSETFEAWHAGLALPVIQLPRAPGAAVRAAGTRIGGPVWLEPGATWPCDAQDKPLEFVAQLDFAETMPLPDFPEAGLLQFFVQRDDLFGVDVDDPLRGQARVIWRPPGAATGEPVPPPALGDHASPFIDERVRELGLSLGGWPATMVPSRDDWRVVARLRGVRESEGLDAYLDTANAGLPRWHQVGGHPIFTQHDFRRPGHYAAYDRVLLRLVSDDALRWGDMGEAMFLISRDDLRARDFSRVAFYWDCH